MKKEFPITRDVLQRTIFGQDYEWPIENHSHDLDLCVAKVLYSLLTVIYDPELSYQELLKDLSDEKRLAVDYRWAAIAAILQGQYDDALTNINEAIRIYEEKKLEVDQLNALLDKRHIEMQMAQLRGEVFTVPEDTQKKIVDMFDTCSPSKYYFKLAEAWSLSMDDQFTLATDSPYTWRMGSNFHQALDMIVDCFVYAIQNGSYMLIQHTKEQLALMLYTYSRIFRDYSLCYQSFKMMVCSTKIDKAKRIMLSNWDDIYTYIVKSIPSILSMFQNTPKLQDKSIKLAVYSRIAYLLPDDSFADFVNELFESLEEKSYLNKDIDLRRNALEALSSIMARIDNNLVIQRTIDYHRDTLIVQMDYLQMLRSVQWRQVEMQLVKKIISNLLSEQNDLWSNISFINVVADISNSYPEEFSSINNDLYYAWLDNRKYDTISYFSRLDYGLPNEWVQQFLTSLLSDVASFPTDSLSSKSIDCLINILLFVYHASKEKFANGSFQDLVCSMLTSLKQILLRPKCYSDVKEKCIEILMELSHHYDHKHRGIIALMDDAYKNHEGYLFETSEELFMSLSNRITYNLKLVHLLLLLNIVDAKYAMSFALKFAFSDDVKVVELALNIVRRVLMDGSKGFLDVALLLINEKKADSWSGIRDYALSMVKELFVNELISMDEFQSHIDKFKRDPSPKVKFHLINMILSFTDDNMPGIHALVHGLWATLRNDPDYRFRVKADEIREAFHLDRGNDTLCD